jgi:hypothetical protein
MARQKDEALEKLLSDPLTLSLMRADGVDPIVLRADLRRVAERVRTRKLESSPQGPGGDSSYAWADLLRGRQAIRRQAIHGPSADAPHGDRA